MGSTSPASLRHLVSFIWYQNVCMHMMLWYTFMAPIKHELLMKHCIRQLQSKENNRVASSMSFNRSNRTSQTYVKYIWRDFVSNCTLHGLRFVFEKRPIRQRLFWFLFMAFMLGFFAWQTLMLAQAYLKFKVESKVKLISERQSVFPAVTICNFNKYRKSALNGSKFKEIVKHMNPLHGESISIDWKKFSDINSVNMTELVSSIGHKMKYDKKTKRGMLYRCRWKDRPCSDSNFTRILTDMGVCYTFNSGK